MFIGVCTWRRKSEIHDELISLLRGWRGSKANEAVLQEIYKELKDLGGLEVAREIDALDLLFKEEFEIPFNPGDYFQNKRNGHILRYIGIDDKVKPPIKRLAFENLSQVGVTSYLEPDSINLFVPISRAEAEVAMRKKGGRRRRQ